MRPRAAIFALALSMPLSAQIGGLSFSYQTAPTVGAIALAPGGTVPFPQTQQGFTSTVTFLVSNRDQNPWTLSEAQAEGAGFTLTWQTGPIINGGTRFLSIHFSPAAAGSTAGILTLRLSGSNGATATPSFQLAVRGESGQTSPQNAAIISFINYNGGNQTILNNGDTIQFPATTVGVRGSLAVVVNNRNVTGPIALESVAVTGSYFDSSGVTLLPASIVGGGEMRFSIGFIPIEPGEFTGTIAIKVSGVTHVFFLRALAQAAILELEMMAGDAITRVTPNDTIEFPRTSTAGGRNVIRFRLRNSGNAEGRWGVIAVSGSSFQLIDPPAPGIIRPGEILPFSIAFTPREVGDHRGQLRLDNTQWGLAGKSSGPQLLMSLVFGDVVVALKPTGFSVIPNTDIGGRRTFWIEVANTGDEVGFLAAVSIVGEGFALSRSQQFPMPVPAGQAVRIEALFAPTQIGTVEGKLVVHDTSYNVIGVANEPPPLPAATFVGIPRLAEALQQPAAALELAEPYPYDLTGRLILSFSSESLIDDPAVQFVSGNRTVDFRIPARTTRAIFGSSLREIRFQTGSLAGTITLVAQISVGKYDLTRATPPLATIDVPAGPPVIRSVLISPRSGRAIDVIISGASPARSVSRLLLGFTPSPGARLQVTSLTVDVGAQFETWYQSSNSRPYGGQFTVNLTLEFSSDYSAVASMAVRAANGLGTSAAKTVTVTSRD